MLEPTRTQSLIDRYFSEEEALKARQLSMATLDLKLEAAELAMLTTIAKRFNKSRTELAQEVITQALVDLIARMPVAERKLLARDADEMSNKLAFEIAEENGLTAPTGKSTMWSNHEKQIVKDEKRLAKMVEERDGELKQLKAQLAQLQNAGAAQADNSEAEMLEEPIETSVEETTTAELDSEEMSEEETSEQTSDSEQEISQDEMAEQEASNDGQTENAEDSMYAS